MPKAVPKTEAKSPTKSGEIRVGIGGWTYEPWRGEFYPKGLPHARELTYASERLTSIEINGISIARNRPPPSPNGRRRRGTASCSP